MFFKKTILGQNIYFKMNTMHDTNSSMKLLILTNNPNRASFRQRFGNYLDILSAAGIEPTVMVLSKYLTGRIQQYCRAKQYNVVILHKKCLNIADALFFTPHRKNVIFNYDDAIMFNDRGKETKTHQKRFQRSLQKAGKVLVGSSYLADRARPYHSDIVILPLGLNTADYSPETPKSADGKLRLVWIGSAATVDYIRQLTPVLQKLAARYSNLVLRLIGDEFIEMEGVVIEKVRWQADTRARALAECDIGLAPLPDTPFTRGKCSFKVLEYSASGLPVVASPVGTNTDHIQQGQTGFLAVSPDQWLEKISMLIENPARRNEMGQKGVLFAKHFDRAVVGKKLCEIIQQMVR
jgi:glycosyltransferase involved in cell wall biosynthesis